MYGFVQSNLLCWKVCHAARERAHMKEHGNQRRKVIVTSQRHTRVAYNGCMLLLWRCPFKTVKITPLLQFIITDRKGLLSTPASNGRTIPLIKTKTALKEYTSDDVCLDMRRQRLGRRMSIFIEVRPPNVDRFCCKPHSPPRTAPPVHFHNM